MQNFTRKARPGINEQKLKSTVDSKDKVIHTQRNIIKSLHQGVKKRDRKITNLYNMIEAMKEKLEEHNIPISSVNFKKKKQKADNQGSDEDGEVLFEPLDVDSAEKLYCERDGTPSQEDDKVNAIVRYQSGRLTPFQCEEREYGFSSPEREYESAYLSPYDKHVLESLEIDMPQKKKTIETSLEFIRQQENQRSHFAPKKSTSKPAMKRKDLRSEERKAERSPSKLENVLPHPLAVSGLANNSKVLNKVTSVNKSLHMSRTNLENLDRKIQLYNHNSSFKLPGIQGSQNLRRSHQKPLTLKQVSSHNRAINRNEKLKNAAATQQGYLEEQENI